MQWDCELSILFNGSGLLPCVFSSQILAVDISCDNFRPTWYQSGYLESTVDVDGESFKGNTFKLRFGKQIIQVPYFNYRLKYCPKGWLVNPTIKIKNLSNTQSINIMPLSSPMPTSIGQVPIIDSLPTTFNAPQYLAASPATSYQALPANQARQNYSVTNTGTATVFLDFDAPTAANKRFQSIPPNGTYTGDFNYVGAIFLWSTNATAQACEVRELI